MLLDEARRLLTAANDALTATRDAASGKMGRVRLGYVGSGMYGLLPDRLRSFKRDHPNEQVELREMTTTGQVAALRSGKLDLGVLIPPLGNAGGLLTAPFDTDRLAIALPSRHELALAESVTIADLLTLTVRGLERDGFITRTVTPSIPPRVDYALIDLGHSVLEAARTTGEWAATHRAAVESARQTFDARAALDL